MIKYIGSKRVLLPKIVAVCQGLQEEGTVLDLFSGTARVGHALKEQGYHVVANDHNSYAHTLAACYVETDRDACMESASDLIAELNQVPPQEGYFTETFCKASRFFHPKNGAKIDAIREAIAAKDLDPNIEAVVLTSLMEAADRVDSTCGVQMAYLKGWAKRAHNDLELRVPKMLPGHGRALQQNAIDAASVATDIVYLDPPYNQHRYLANYHIWETLVKWDKPKHYGKACKRIDCKDYSSRFNSKREIKPALERVLDRLNAKHIVLSFSNEGHMTRKELESLLGDRGHLSVYGFDNKRYVGAQIGIHNLQGEKVGDVSHLRNVEYLYVLTSEKGASDRIARSLDRVQKQTEPQLDLL